MDREDMLKELTKIAYAKTYPFCYSCYKRAPSGRCASCGSDDLMRELEGNGVEYGTEWVIESLLKTELTEIDTDEAYEEWLGEVYSEPVEVCGMSMDQVHILKNMDPVAYRCGKSDWESSEDGETMISFDNGSTFYSMSEVEEFIEANEVEDVEPSDETVSL